VFEVPRMLMLSLSEVDEDQFIGDVALFGYQGHAARVRGILGSVKLEYHGERRG
jgi:hypothetical protein